MARQLFPALRRGVEDKGLAARVRSISTRYVISGVPYDNQWNVARAVKEGFEANPWIFRGIEVLCYSALSRKVVLRRGDPDNGPLISMGQDSTRILFRLNRRANPWETAKMFRYRLIAQFVLSSKGVYVEVTRSRAGAIAMLTLLDPDLVDVIPNPTNPIAAFRIRTTGDTGGYFDTLPPFDPDNDLQTNSVLWIRSPHPTQLPAAVSPLQPAGMSIDLDKYARMYNRDYMQSNGRPGGILAVKGTVADETVKALEARFNGGARPGEVTAIQADAMDYRDLSTTPRDMQWSEAMDRAKSEASIVLGVPMSLMGDASDRTFDNADAEYATYMEHRFGPLIGIIDDQLDILTGGQDDDTWLRHDLSDVWVLARHRREEEDRAMTDYEQGIRTIDDVREVKGLERLDVPATRVLLVPAGRVAVGDGGTGHDDDAKDTGAAPMVGTPAPPDPGAEAQQGADQGAALASYNAQTAIGANQFGGGGANLRAVGGLNERSALAAVAPAELEGKESGARDERPRRRADAPVWR